MGRRKGKGLLKLGLKRPPKKIWIPEGFGSGYYKFVKPVQKPNCQVVHFFENKNGLEIWEENVKPMTLERMGLVRDEKSGKITLKVKPT